jgi:hypothetical protein
MRAHIQTGFFVAGCQCADLRRLFEQMVFYTGATWVCMYVHVCICMYVYACGIKCKGHGVHMCIYVRMCMYVYMCEQMASRVKATGECMCMHVCMCIYVYACAGIWVSKSRSLYNVSETVTRYFDKRLHVILINGYTLFWWTVTRYFDKRLHVILINGHTILW